MEENTTRTKPLRKGTRKKLSLGNSPFSDLVTRPTVSPPPPPGGALVSTEVIQDEPKQSSKTKSGKKDKQKSKFYEAEDEENVSPPQSKGRRHSSESKSVKRQTSKTSAKFYVSLDREETSQGTSLDSPVSHDSGATDLSPPSGTNESSPFDMSDSSTPNTTTSPISPPASKQKEQASSSSLRSIVRKTTLFFNNLSSGSGEVSGSPPKGEKVKRQLPQVPIKWSKGDKLNSVGSKTEAESGISEISDSDMQKDSSPCGSMTQSNAMNPPNGNANSDPHTETPIPPTRRKRRRRIRRDIKTLDFIRSPEDALTLQAFNSPGSSAVESSCDSLDTLSCDNDCDDLNDCEETLDHGENMKDDTGNMEGTPSHQKGVGRRKLPQTPPIDKRIDFGGLTVAPKPQILRPKPKIPRVRDQPSVTSFTAEDFDICQKKSGHNSPGAGNGHQSRKDAGKTSPGDRIQKRRSRSVGAPQIGLLLAQLKKPVLPEKPRLRASFVPEGLPTKLAARFDDKPTSKSRVPPERPRQLPPKPKLNTTNVKEAVSHEDLTEKSRTQLTPDTEAQKLNRRSVSLDTGLETLIEQEPSESQSNYDKVDESKTSCTQKTQDGVPCKQTSGINDSQSHPTSKQPGNKVVSDDEDIYEPIELKKVSPEVKIISESKNEDDNDSIYANVEYQDKKESEKSNGVKHLCVPNESTNSKPDRVKPTRKASRKVSRKESARRWKRNQKSFRNKVYEDVDLQDEIPEGEEEENLEFSESDEEDDSFSEDEFTDSEDLEFEQIQVMHLKTPDKTSSDENGDSESPKKDKLYRIANELLTTEEAYMKRLHLIDQVFHWELIMENRKTRFLPEDLIPQIFLNIKSIYGFHDFLLKQLQERMGQWESIKKIGDVMMRWAPFLKLYTEYINKFDNAMNMLNLAIEKYPKFASMLDEIQKRPECEKLTLQHHMLGPIQRVPRYEMLLKDYLKHLPEDSPDRGDTEKALDLVTKAAAHANETIRKNEKSQKLLNLSEHLIGASSLNLISPTRELIKEGPIIKVSARDASHQERYLFLFNDCLIVCVPVTLSKLGIAKHQYKFKVKLDIEGMRVMEGDDLYTPNTFLVKSKSKSIEFHASSAEVTDSWQAALWKTIAEFTKKQRSRRIGPTLSENFQEEELGKRAPTWIKDQAASMCMICAREFTTFFRRHHCRACGRVVCGLCSARKSALAYDNSKMNRVCDNCYNILELKLEPDTVLSRGQQKTSKGLRGVKANDASVMSGYLHMSQNKKTWEKRFFAVRPNFVLYSFKAHQDVFALTSLPLPGYIVGVVKDENQLKGKFVFKIFHIGLKKEYYFQTEDKPHLQRWVSILEKMTRAELPDESETLPFLEKTSLTSSPRESILSTATPTASPTPTSSPSNISLLPTR